MVEAAIYIAVTGPYWGFWVAACAEEACGYFGECWSLVRRADDVIVMS